MFSARGANYDWGQKGQLHRVFALFRPFLKDMANWDIINVAAGEVAADHLFALQAFGLRKFLASLYSTLRMFIFLLSSSYAPQPQTFGELSEELP